jgi:hypothetical protein
MAFMPRRNWGENSIYFQHDGDCADPAPALPFKVARCHLREIRPGGQARGRQR